jgi:hypothetical protein
MKKVSIILSLAIIAIAGITLSSCQKSTTDSIAPASESSSWSNFQSQIKSGVLQHILGAYMQDQQEKGNLKSGAEFIPAFTTNDGFGFIKDFVGGFDPVCGCFVITSGEFAFFNTDLGENDFYRLNPDSTVSVHINSTDGSAFYNNIGDNTVAFGSGFNLAINYTGAWVAVTYEWDGVTYTYQFVDTGSNPNAAVWHASGKVQFDGTGPKHNMVAQLTADPGWTNVNLQLNVN